MVSTEAIRGSIFPALKSAAPVGSSVTFLLWSSASACADGLPPVPSAPNCDGSIGPEEAAVRASTTWSGVIALNSPATWAGAAGSSGGLEGSAAAAFATPRPPLGIAGRSTRERTLSTESGTSLRWGTRSLAKS